MKRIYCNGTILTMATPIMAEAVCTEDGKILAVGARNRLLQNAPDAQLYDLDGCTLMPAFVDAHSHLSSFAASLLQVALDEAADFDEIASRVRTFLSDHNIAPGEWVIAKGYDHNTLAERQHPTRALLDACAPRNPLLLQHASGHVGMLNTLALKKLGITAATPVPQGGRIEVVDGEPTGYLEENAFFAYLKQVPTPDGAALLGAYQAAQDCYLAHGIPTIQEGMTVKEMIPLYQALLSHGLLKTDLVAYASLPDADALFAAFPNAVGKYDGHFKIGGYKIFLDGSPQGRTAWMRTPYAGAADGYCGYGTMQDAEVIEAIETAVAHNMQILAHCNGDAAAQQFLDALERVGRRCNIAALRPVLIHGQLLGRDQLVQVKRLGVTPSFFVAHLYHWGDVHIQNFGMARASAISPTASALRAGIRFTFHQDSPVILPDMFETIQCAVSRVTKNGVLLGAEERIPVFEALKAVTVNAAWQSFEENRKGSIAAGKDADFVVLDKNPLAVPTAELHTIRVIQTILKDQVLYSART